MKATVKDTYDGAPGAASTIDVSPDVSSFPSSSPESFWSKRIFPLIDPCLDKFDEETMVTSHHVSPEFLLNLRLFLFVWCIHPIIMQLVSSRRVPNVENRIFFITYFTNLSWLGLMLHLLLSAYNTWIYIRDGYSAARLRARPAWARWLVWNIYILPAVYHYIVPAVFWSVLSLPMFKEPDFLYIWFNVQMHLFDLFFMLAEFFLARIPMFYSQWPGFIFVSLLYMSYAQVLNKTLSPLVSGLPKEYPNGYWVYPFLNTSSSLAPVFYVGLTVAFLGFFAMVTAFHRGRDRKRERLGLKVVKGKNQNLELPMSAASASS